MTGPAMYLDRGRTGRERARHHALAEAGRARCRRQEPDAPRRAVARPDDRTHRRVTHRVEHRPRPERAVRARRTPRRSRPGARRGTSGGAAVTLPMRPSR